MAITYEEHGRTAQKQRTRDALVAAARDIVARGGTPTVEAAALEASISRSTAYRYFPDQRVLLAAAHPEIESTSLLPPDAPADDAGARLDLVVRAFIDLIASTEDQQRTMLRLSLERGPSRPTDLPLRQGRAIGWFEEALDPVRPVLGDAGCRRLVLAVRATTGIESLVWLTDVAGLDRDEAAELMARSASALFRAAVDEAGAT